jgi:TonB family protein
MSAKPPKKSPPTDRGRARNFLLYAFGLSILIHLLIGPLVQFKRSPEAPETPQQTVKIERMPTPPPTPKPTPKPTPTPTPPPSTPPPKSTPQPPKQAIKINTLKTKATTGGPTEAANTHTTGSDTGSPQGTSNSPQPTSAPVAATPVPPTPTPSPTPLTCAVPNADARTVTPVPPETPAIAQQQGITGEVVVQVTLDENSKIVDAKVIRTPSSLLNKAALDATRQSVFKTRIANCKPVAESYNYIVEFQSQ